MWPSALLVVVGAALGAVAAFGPSAGADSPSLSVFRRVGAWVDVFDYAPRLQKAGTEPRVTPDSIGDMAALGVKTLYVQVANPDGAPAEPADRPHASCARCSSARTTAASPWCRGSSHAR